MCHILYAFVIYFIYLNCWHLSELILKSNTFVLRDGNINHVLCFKALHLWPYEISQFLVITQANITTLIELLQYFVKVLLKRLF